MGVNKFGIIGLGKMGGNLALQAIEKGHVLKVDFWDINEMVNKIISVLDHQELQKTLSHHAHQEVRRFSWHDAAQKCIDLYKRIFSAHTK